MPCWVDIDFFVLNLCAAILIASCRDGQKRNGFIGKTVSLIDRF